MNARALYKIYLNTDYTNALAHTEQYELKQKENMLLIFFIEGQIYVQYFNNSIKILKKIFFSNYLLHFIVFNSICKIDLYDLYTI